MRKASVQCRLPSKLVSTLGVRGSRIRVAKDCKGISLWMSDDSREGHRDACSSSVMDISSSGNDGANTPCRLHIRLTALSHTVRRWVTACNFLQDWNTAEFGFSQEDRKATCIPFSGRWYPFRQDVFVCGSRYPQVDPPDTVKPSIARRDSP